MKTEDALIVVYVTATVDEAPALAQMLVSERLAACVNIVPKIRSIYRWQGKISDDEEALLIIKTRADRFGDLSRTVRREHSYDIPEIIGFPIPHAEAEYQAWAMNAVPPPTRSSQ